jgi:hypothetical protein
MLSIEGRSKDKCEDENAISQPPVTTIVKNCGPQMKKKKKKQRRHETMEKEENDGISTRICLIC